MVSQCIVFNGVVLVVSWWCLSVLCLMVEFWLCLSVLSQCTVFNGVVLLVSLVVSHCLDVWRWCHTVLVSGSVSSFGVSASCFCLEVVSQCVLSNGEVLVV